MPTKTKWVERLDFHSFRHTFISNLTRSGVSPKIAQSLAQHSTIGLTMGTYTHVGLYDERTALDSLPELPSLNSDRSEDNKATAVKTGTEDLPITATESPYKPAYKKLTKNAYFDNNKLASDVVVQKADKLDVDGFDTSDKPLLDDQLGNKCPSLSPQ